MRVKSDARYELKYLISWQQRDALLAAIRPRMAVDEYGDSGAYRVTSLYYDTVDYRAYWEKIEGERFRRKVRVRVYGEDHVTDETPVFVEIKQRQNKTLTKKRVHLPHKQAQDLDQLGRLAEAMEGDRRAVLEEIHYLHRVLDLRPTCVVRYRRLALNGSDEHPDLRITFDTDLRCRGHDLTLLSTGYADDVYFIPPNVCVLELKANSTIPYWLAQLVNQQGAVPRRVSKYCSALERCGLVSEQRTLSID